MKQYRTWLGTIVLLLVCTAVHAAAPADKARKLAPRITDYYFKHQVIRIGLPAVDPLFEQLAKPKDEKIAFETRSALRWIAEGQAASPKDRCALLDLLKAQTQPGKPAAVRAFAVELLGSVGGKEAMGVIVPLLSDEAVRDSACAALTQIPGPEATQALMSACDKAPPEFRCAVLHALGVRGDTAAQATLVKATNDKNEAVSLAAIKALGEMGCASGVEPLAKIMKSASDKQKAAAFESMIAIGDALLTAGKASEGAAVYGKALELAASDDQRRLALACLGKSGDPAVVPKLEQRMASGSAAVKTAAQLACVNVADDLWDEGKKDHAAAMYLKVLNAASDDAVRVRALIGCGRSGSTDSIPQMAALLTRGSPRVRAAAASAIKLIPGDAATRAMAKALPSAPPAVQAVLLTALAERCDPNTVQAIAPLAASPNEDVAAAAVTALGSTGSPAAVEPLAGALKSDSDRVEEASIDACLRLARTLTEKEDAVHAAQVYCRLLDLAKDESVRTQVFTGLRNVPSAAVAAKITPLIEKEKGDAKEQAVNALLACADKIFASDKKASSKPIYQTILKNTSVGSRQAMEARYKLTKLGERLVVDAKDGAVSFWWVIGTWGARDEKSWKKEQGPERDLKKGKPIDLNKESKRGKRILRWMPAMTDDKKSKMDMNPLFINNDRCVSYCYCEVTVDKEQEVTAHINSDDGHRFFVNDKLVHEYLKDRKRNQKGETAKLTLKAGVNKFLLKTCDRSGKWWFSLRLTGADGKPPAFKMK